ncbi:hypothetical protein NDU88_003692 [Pleurodeles waltl]|uniref:Uncharacterized protein n=1 Tax=Pleurodeles waltl TaxID=8319 RepID=A0AAV7PDK3_PLEWA|nr:hypothetical protein NDU88_003692 [Pleurodeles waltl]
MFYGRICVRSLGSFVTIEKRKDATRHAQGLASSVTMETCIDAIAHARFSNVPCRHHRDAANALHVLRVPCRSS